MLKKILWLACTFITPIVYGQTENDHRIFVEWFDVNDSIRNHHEFTSSTAFDDRTIGSKGGKEETDTRFTANNLQIGAGNFVEISDLFISPDSIHQETIFLSIYLDSLDTFLKSGKINQCRFFFSIKASDYQNNVYYESKSLSVVAKNIHSDSLRSIDSDDLDDYRNRTEVSVTILMGALLEEICALSAVTKFESGTSEQLNLKAGADEVEINQPFDRAKNAIALSGWDYTISGIALTSKYILTDYRIFRDPEREIKLFYNQTDSAEVKLIRANKIHNLAILELTETSLPNVTSMLPDKDVGLLDSLFAFGTPYSEKWFNTLVQGVVAGKKEIKGAASVFIDGITHLSYTGCGVFDQKGALVGVAVAKDFDENVNLVIPIVAATELEELLNVKLW